MSNKIHTFTFLIPKVISSYDPFFWSGPTWKKRRFTGICGPKGNVVSMWIYIRLQYIDIHNTRSGIGMTHFPQGEVVMGLPPISHALVELSSTASRCLQLDWLLRTSWQWVPGHCFWIQGRCSILCLFVTMLSLKVLFSCFDGMQTFFWFDWNQPPFLRLAGNYPKKLHIGQVLAFCTYILKSEVRFPDHLFVHVDCC